MGRPATSGIEAAIFDVDGVILDSPHEQAWREALVGYTDPRRLTTEIYQEHVAGKPRMMGARDLLEHLEVQDASARAAEYAERKQQIVLELIQSGHFTAYPDALRFIHRLRGEKVRLAVASSSRNANIMLKQIKLDEGFHSLFECFEVNVCGRDLRRGKPDPEIFLLAAKELRITPSVCFVAEDAPAGIQAAKAGGMTGLGVARHHDADLLSTAGADLVVTSLDDAVLAAGRLCRRTPCADARR
jgi:HAD superfamily hydrolase (TIGR01509 family)